MKRRSKVNANEVPAPAKSVQNASGCIYDLRPSAVPVGFYELPIEGPCHEMVRNRRLGSAQKERELALHFVAIADFRALGLGEYRTKLDRLEKTHDELLKEHENLKAERDKLVSKCSNLQVRFEAALKNGLCEIAQAFARGLKG